MRIIVAGNTLDIEYPIAPKQESWGLAPISVVLYKTQSPVSEAKKDSAMVEAPTEEQEERNKSVNDLLTSDLGTKMDEEQRGRE